MEEFAGRLVKLPAGAEGRLLLSALRHDCCPGLAQEYTEILAFLDEQVSARFWIRYRNLKPSQLNRLRFAAAIAGMKAMMAPLCVPAPECGAAL